MPYPIDLTTLSNEMLISGYAAIINSSHEDNNDLDAMRDSMIAAHKKEIDSRIEESDSLGLFAIAQLVAKYFPGSFDSPIRKKITYSPTGQKAPGWIGIFSRKNRRIDSDSN